MREVTVAAQGWDASRYEAETAFIYGEQTWGSLFADGDGQPIPYTDNSARPYITKSLEILGISEQDLKRMHVFNIGTGREAIIFRELGAGEVTLLDIAKANVENTARYAQRHGLSNISTIHGDIEEVALPSDSYDLVFLAGVYQHIRTPATALINLAQALKPGGKMYLGFYRSGEWKYFIVDTIRHLLPRGLFATVKRQIALSCTLGQARHYQMARMLDDFFVPCQHKFHPRMVIHDAQRLGLAVQTFDNDFREYHHEGGGYFSIGGDRIYLTKAQARTPRPDLTELQTTRGLNQLTDVPYAEPLIHANLQLIRQLRELIVQGRVPEAEVALLAINLYRFTRPFDPEHDEYFQRSVKEGRHRTLNGYVTNVVRAYGSTNP